MRRTRNIAFVVLIIAVAVTAAAATWELVRKTTSSRETAGIGGPFSLIDQHGRRVTERDFQGKPSLVFFGFTFCPDICPTTLTELTGQLKELGPRADALNVIFVTVDPERDTPEQLALYLSSFDPHITGLSGTTSDIAKMMAGYRVFARKVPLPDGSYTMDHSATVYMMNSRGKFVGFLTYQESADSVRVKIKRLLGDTATG
jgi:protein SCO1/2